MIKILVVYGTDWGSTKKMAEAICRGVQSVSNSDCVVKLAHEATQEDTLSADALILGSPVHMGSPDCRVKEYIDKVCSKIWMKDLMVGKVGAVFASGGGFGNAGGGVELTLLALLANLAELGLVIVPLPKNTPGYHAGGIHWGPYGRSMGENMEQTGLADEKVEAAFNHGANVARLTHLLKGQKFFSENRA